MPKSHNYNSPWRYRGADDECHLCGGEKLPWRDCMLCVVCDNRDDGEGTWFEAFAETEDPGPG